MTFGRVIRVRRQQLKLGQRELAERLDLTQQTISRWEQGDDLPAPDHFRALAYALELAPTELLRLAGYSDINPTTASLTQVVAYLHEMDDVSLVDLSIEALLELRRRGDRDAVPSMTRTRSWC